MPRLKQLELQILRHLANGLTTHEIAEVMNYHPKTVGAYRTLLYAKIDARNAAHAVAIALREGWIR